MVTYALLIKAHRLLIELAFQCRDAAFEILANIDLPDLFNPLYAKILTCNLQVTTEIMYVINSRVNN